MNGETENEVGFWDWDWDWAGFRTKENKFGKGIFEEEDEFMEEGK